MTIYTIYRKIEGTTQNKGAYVNKENAVREMNNYKAKEEWGAEYYIAEENTGIVEETCIKVTNKI